MKKFILICLFLTACNLNKTPEDRYVYITEGVTFLGKGTFICDSCEYQGYGAYIAKLCRNPITDTFAAEIAPAQCVKIPKDSIK